MLGGHAEARSGSAAELCKCTVLGAHQDGAAVFQAAFHGAQLLLDPVEEGAVVVHAVQLPPHILQKSGMRNCQPLMRLPKVALCFHRLTRNCVG